MRNIKLWLFIVFLVCVVIANFVGISMQDPQELILNMMAKTIEGIPKAAPENILSVLPEGYGQNTDKVTIVQQEEVDGLTFVLCQYPVNGDTTLLYSGVFQKSMFYPGRKAVASTGEVVPEGIGTVSAKDYTLVYACNFTDAAREFTVKPEGGFVEVIPEALSLKPGEVFFDIFTATQPGSTIMTSGQ